MTQHGTSIKYRINWRDFDSDQTGQGEAIFGKREDAQAFANEMNRKYPRIHHWVTGHVAEVEAK